jgi:hypothetical protein
MMIIILLICSLPSRMSASSFVIQQFTDTLNDFNVTFGKDLDCKRVNYRIPDIVGVSYTSDGDVLNSTTWLGGTLTDPSKLVRDTNVTVYFFDIENFTGDVSLMKYITIKEGRVIPINADNTMKSKSSENFTIYDYPTTGRSVMIVDKSPKYYIITFDTPIESFQYYYPTAKKIFDSIPSNKEIIIDNVSVPADWYVTQPNVSYAIAKFTPIHPLYTHIVYSMTIQVTSPIRYGEPHSDYKVSLDWQWPNKYWTEKVEQMSIYKKGLLEQQNKLLNKKVIDTPDFVNTSGNGSHIDLTVKLKTIGSPNSYAVFSNVQSNFFIKQLDDQNLTFCGTVDNTAWVVLPPPKIAISVSPTSLIIGPNETGIIHIRANSSTMNPTKISFNSLSGNGLDLDGYYSPQNLTLAPYGIGYSDLHVFALNYSMSKDIPLRLTADAEFPSYFIDTSSGYRYISDKIEGMPLDTYVQIRILNLQDRIIKQLTDSYNTFASSVTAFSVVIAAIVTIVTPLLAIFGRNYINARKENARKKNTRKKN